MHKERLKLVTIVIESVLADELVTELKKLGVTGHTMTTAQGEGSRGRRVGEVPGDNQRLETVVSPALADRILELCAERYFSHYAIAAWVTDVDVVRGSKYVGA